MELFESLMFRRVRNILLVASPYDAFVFQEDGHLTEALYTDFLQLNLSFTPIITIASTAEEAFQKLATMPFDLIVNILRFGDMDVRVFGEAAERIAPGVPVLLLAYNTRELGMLQDLGRLPGIDRVFVWLGDVRLFLAMIKYVEDRLNAPFDIGLAGVQCIILVEDNVRFYSTYLPVLYGELVIQTQALMSDAVDRMDRLLRMRARPKVLLATSYEEAETLYKQYRRNVAGVVLDGAFPKDGRVNASAGISFARMAREGTPDRPVLIQSSDHRNRSAAYAAGADFIDKGSISLLHDVKQFLDRHLGFGDFVFKSPAGEELARAGDLRSLVEVLETVPAESLSYHGGRNDFSTWLMARTEFELARRMRPIDPRSFGSGEAYRQHLIALFNEHREETLAGVIADFTPQTYTAEVSSFVRIGDGSLGGKGRGLAFMHALLKRRRLRNAIPGLEIGIPPTAVLATDAFDQFMETSGLAERVLDDLPDEAVSRMFLEARLTAATRESLRTYLERVDYPLAVRSSSLLEDASYQPFAGIYRTYMIPNNHPRLEVRLAQLETAVKLVYASIFYRDAKAYIDATPNRLEEEKMAVILQRIVGRRRGDLLYPDIAGVARSYNFYPLKGMRSEEGVASVVLGLGKTVVEGGRSVRFSPHHPRSLYQFASPEDALESAQREFLALDLSDTAPAITSENEAPNLVEKRLDVAREDGVLHQVGSVYSPENDAIYDGLSRPGVPLVTMAGVLKADVFPLAEALKRLLALGAEGFASPVEIEFAATIRASEEALHEFSFLQIRPVVSGFSPQEVSVDGVSEADAICISEDALGNGTVTDVRDIIYVRSDAFDRRRTVEIADQVGVMASRLRRENRPTLLIGPGRWGTRDRWLGIPVTWNQIAGVKCVVETDMDDIHVEPSQGTHFFQNMTSFGISYFSVSFRKGTGTLDTEWLTGSPAAQETQFLRHLSWDDPLEIVVNGKSRVGVIMKPGCPLIRPAPDHRS